MMFADHDYGKKPILKASISPVVVVYNMAEKGYLVVNVQCKARSKIYFLFWTQEIARDPVPTSCSWKKKALEKRREQSKGLNSKAQSPLQKWQKEKKKKIIIHGSANKSQGGS